MVVASQFNEAPKLDGGVFILYNFLDEGGFTRSVVADYGAFFAPFADFSYTLSVVFLSLLCSIVSNLLVNYAAGYMSVFKLASFGALSTLVSTIMGVLVLDEPVSAMLLLGAAMILIGVQQVIRPDKKQ